MGKSTISMAIFNSYVSHYQRVSESTVKSKDRDHRGAAICGCQLLYLLRPEAGSLLMVWHWSFHIILHHFTTCYNIWPYVLSQLISLLWLMLIQSSRLSPARSGRRWRRGTHSSAYVTLHIRYTLLGQPCTNVEAMTNMYCTSTFPDFPETIKGFSSEQPWTAHLSIHLSSMAAGRSNTRSSAACEYL